MSVVLTRELVAGVCRCGNRKRPGHTFCKSCFFSLPKRMQTALYKRMGEGYEEAYAAAAAWLKGENLRRAGA